MTQQFANNSVAAPVGRGKTSKALSCFDDETHVWYPSHEWTSGYCSRCGKKQPGTSDEERQEMAAQDAGRKRYDRFLTENGPWASTDEARRAYDELVGRIRR